MVLLLFCGLGGGCSSFCKYVLMGGVTVVVEVGSSQCFIAYPRMVCAVLRD